MHNIEPYYNWRHHYIASEDKRSPFYGREYSEVSYTHAIYDHVIHPQWDDIGSQTMFIKILFAEYDSGVAVIEMIGEWNDAIENDIMILKREIIELLMEEGINKFVLIGENILNYHHSDDSYYEEWFDDVCAEDGWIALLDFRDHVLKEFKEEDLDSYFVIGGELDVIEWRTMQPAQLINKVEGYVQKRLGVV